MRKKVLTILLLSLSVLQASGQKISRTYQNQSLSEVLKDLNAASPRYEVSFIYNELEDFRVTTTIHHSTIPDAVRQVVGFYPMRIIETDSVIVVECTHKTEYHLTGNIIDEKNHSVAYANIAVLNPTDSILLCGGISNESGVFVIPIDQPDVIVRISYVGYKTIYKHCTSTKLGTIKMQPETQVLKGVIVKGQTPILHREAGTIVFNTRHILGAIDATDLLRYAPGILLTDNDITLFGTSGIIFCINGKEQRMNQNEILQILKSYPASDIEKIEIIQTPDAKYSAAGNAGVINLVLKKKDNNYIGGSIGYAHTRYEEQGNEANANVIYIKDKVSTSVNVSGTWNNNRYKETNTIMLDNRTRENIDNGHIKNDNYTARWQIDYNASNRLNLGAYAMVSEGDRNLDVNGEYIYSIEDDFSSDVVNTETRRSEDTKTCALNANASHKLNDKGAKIDYNLDYYHMSMGDNRKSEALNVLSGNTPDDFYYQNDIAQTVSNYSAKIDANISNFLFGTQYSLTRSRRKLVYSWTPDYHQTSDFVYDEQVLSAYTEYNGKLGEKLSFNIGGRYERTWTTGHRMANSGYDAVHHSQYDRLFPSLSMGYKPNHNHSLNLSLSSRITRPNIINVNPDTLCNDAYHSTTGNPFLKPTYLYKVMMGYTYKGVLSFDLYYAFEPNRMAQVSCLGYSHTTFVTWDNIVDEQIFGINSFYYFDRLRWLNAILMQGVYWSRTTGDGLYTLLDMKGWSYTGVLQTSFFFDQDRRWTANFNFTFSSREKDVTKTLHARYMADLGLQYRFWKDCLTLGLTCRNLFASHIKGTEYLGNTVMDFDNTFNYRQLRLTLTYNWGARLKQNRRQYQSDEVKNRVVNDF